ncbi:hypothetical protein PR003_g17641 [Phytophthora rubi]|uniref:Uncharacterized protein n=1 Tax=Phytophthora rubi TaxID=129364 RepID=A0A6A4E6P8_9STRA|nr:hypothetical protein PR003_g17641 [Phytophthora rubi]
MAAFLSATAVSGVTAKSKSGATAESNPQSQFGTTSKFLSATAESEPSVTTKSMWPITHWGILWIRRATPNGVAWLIG